MESSTSTNGQVRHGFEKIGALEKVGFASGDLACNLIFQTVTTYLLFFYTDVFGISAAAAGVMFLVVRLFDTIQDPIAGVVVDKTNSRWGRFRPYLLFGAVPFALIAILCFTTPDFSMMGKLVYAYLTYTVLSLTYTWINTPYGALTAAITRDHDQVVSMTSLRMIFANLGGLIVGFGVPYLAQLIDQATSTESAWQLTMTIMGIAGCGLLFFTFATTKERVPLTDKTAGKIQFKDLILQLKSNRPLVVLCIFFIIFFGVLSIVNSSGVYYVTYNVGRADLVKWWGLLGALPAFILLPLLPYLSKKLSRKWLMNSCLGLMVVGSLLLIVTPTTNVPLVLFDRFLIASGLVVAGGFLWSLVPETIEYGEYKTKRRAGGVIYALVGFFFKFGMALGGIVPGLLLSKFGYVANVEQTATSLKGIMIITTIIPIMLLVAAIIVFCFYNLNDEKYQKIVKTLASREIENNK